MTTRAIVALSNLGSDFDTTGAQETGKINMSAALKSSFASAASVSAAIAALSASLGAAAFLGVGAGLSSSGGSIVLGDGSGVTYTPASKSLQIGGATVAVSSPVLSLTQTWNAGGVAFTGLKLNITDTASAAGSLLADLQVGGVSKFSVSKTGGITTAANSTLGGTTTLGNATISGFAWLSSNASQILIGASQDVALNRDAANTLALRNSTSAQTFNLYNTYTDASNYERAVFDWQGTANVLTIGTGKLGTGSTRNLQFVIGGVVKADFGISTANWWTFTAAGLNVSGGAIQAGGLIQSSSYVQAGASAPGGSGGFYIGGNGGLSSNAAGIFTLTNNAGTDFGRLQFGGTTSSFPAIKRSGAGLAIRLADDTADAALSVGSLTFPNGSINSTGDASFGAANFVISGGVFAYTGMYSLGFYGFSNSTATIGGTFDIRLYRDGAGLLAQRNLTNAQSFRVYNTYTDASNYERAIFDWQGLANVLTIGTENLGTGSARNMRFVIGGVSKLDYGISTSGLWTVGAALRTSAGFTAAASIAVTAGGSIGMWSGAPFGWTSVGGVSEAGITLDTRFSRVAAGIVKIDNGSTGAGCVVTQAVAFASLPSATTAGDGARAFINDCNVTASGNFGAAAAGGGANKVPVYAQGGTWYIG